MGQKLLLNCGAFSIAFVAWSVLYSFSFAVYDSHSVETLVPLTERLVLAGYRNSGFPDATTKITVESLSWFQWHTLHDHLA